MSLPASGDIDTAWTQLVSARVRSKGHPEGIELRLKGRSQISVDETLIREGFATAWTKDGQHRDLLVT